VSIEFSQLLRRGLFALFYFQPLPEQHWRARGGEDLIRIAAA